MPDLDANLDWPVQASRLYRERVAKVAAKLRYLADEVEREGDPDSPFGRTNHVSAAGRVIHDVAWGVANLHLDSLLSVADLADEARRDANS